MANKAAAIIGSWKFIAIQSVFVLIWISLNLLAYLDHWDPFPFILLNFILSAQAAYAAPVIMMSQNRQNERDRRQAYEDFITDKQSKKEIEELQRTLTRIEDKKLSSIIQILEEVRANKK